MRIGIDCRLWAQTGVGRYIRNLVQNLLILDKKNTYILFVRKQDYGIINEQLSIIKHQNKFKIENLKLKIVDIKWHSLQEQLKFPSILEKENLDLVHFPYFSVPIFYNKPYVVTIHDLIMDHYPTGNASTLALPLYYSKFLAYKFILKTAAKNAKKIIVPSVATKMEVIDHLKINKEKIVVTYEAADLAISHQPSAISHQNLGKYFLYVGNAYPHKNLERLIKAFNDFSKENKDTKLILVGNKDYFYQKLEAKFKSDKIIYFGKASDEDLASLYNNAIAFVLPSLMEGFGLPVLEAMANKCPVVCSDIPSLKEIAGDSAIYFNPQDVDDITRNLKFIVQNSKFRGETKENGYKKSQEFSWEKMAKETLKTYESSISLR